MAKEPIKGVFFYEDEQGKPCDAKLHEDLLLNEDRIRAELIAAGVIKEIIVVNKQTKQQI